MCATVPGVLADQTISNPFYSKLKSLWFLSDDAFGLSKHTSFVLWVGNIPSLPSHLAWTSIPRLLWGFLVLFFFLMINQRKLLLEKPLCLCTIKQGALGCHLPSGIFRWQKGREMSPTFGLEQVPHFQWKLLPAAQLFNFCQGVNVTACCFFFSCQSLPCRMAHSCSLEFLAKNKCSL